MSAKPPRWQMLVFAGLVTVLVAVMLYTFRDAAGPVRAGQSAVARAGQPPAAAAGNRAESVPGVRLSALKDERPVPAGNGRNLFVDKPKAPPPTPRVTPLPLDPNAPPAPPPPAPPITLKLIGIVQGSGGPVAALTDGKDVFFGREGDVIEGRYRIVKVNVESIDIAYVDGRGQRRLGLSG